MHRIYLPVLLIFPAVCCSQSSYAHDSGGTDRSYNFEKGNHRTNREAEKNR